VVEVGHDAGWALSTERDGLMLVRKKRTVAIEQLSSSQNSVGGGGRTGYWYNQRHRYNRISEKYSRSSYIYTGTVHMRFKPYVNLS
jgi:hypothetical protein